jgi:NAD(P)-dependent dehydrogenase (short-subunit alcohol dehydrogenase family)
MNIQGQAALVTGGASGLGEATARELARLGAKVAVLDVNMALAEKVAADINGIACQCDITSTDSVVAALDKAAAAHGPARILMNIAGIGRPSASSARTAAPRRWKTLPKSSTST